ncbi:MAG: ABC transporter ATP-binding protein [Alphaproteobacteria bacterium]|nr:ABC transporter ATP-binding protein [Alphaproteobacteria bacterium]
MALELRDLRKRFGDVAAIDGVALRIEDGEFFSLLGPSGCGKTTILRTIAGIVTPDAGAVVLGGADITRRPLHARDVTLVFQNYALFPHLTVFDNVAFGLVMRRVARAEIRTRVEEALALVRLAGLGQRYPAQVSGGQQQRVALARALVVRPSVLLLDEPLSNLDARLRDEMRGELREIQRRVGITTILVTHDIHEAFAMSDRIAVLDRGRVEQIGTPTEIYQRPRTRFVATFSGQMNEFDGVVEAVADGRASVATPAGRRVAAAVTDDAPGPGARASVMVRPERVRLDPPADADQRLDAIVESVTYLGGSIRMVARAGGDRLLADLPTGDAPPPAPGARVVLGWRTADAVLVAAG